MNRLTMLADNLGAAGLRAEVATRVARQIVADPQLAGPAGWCGPVDLGRGVVLWAQLPTAGTR